MTESSPSGPSGPSAPPVTAFVLKGYPRLSETFIAQEIKALEDRGLDIRIVSLRHPTDAHRHPVHAEIRAPVTYLPEYLHREPRRVLRGVRRAGRLAGFRRAFALWRRDLIRDPTPNRIRRFGQACVLADELPPGITRLHAHFLHTPASVARYAAHMTGLPWSCSAHAKDVYTTPDWEIREKLADCGWLVTCTEANARYLSALAPAPDRVTRVYHGLDLARFPPPSERPERRNGASPDDPVVILSVGRAVEKKGYPGLLEALGRLPEDLSWRFVHVGGGPLLAKLKAQSRALGLESRVDWLGALPQDGVLRQYRQADLFVLNARIAADGDRDGLPNVLMEAQSQGLSCLSTRVSAISELVEDGETGVLVPPDDARALAEALEDLVRDPVRRETLGTKAEARVRHDFSLDAGIEALATRFGLAAAIEARGAGESGPPHPHRGAA